MYCHSKRIATSGLSCAPSRLDSGYLQGEPVQPLLTHRCDIKLIFHMDKERNEDGTILDKEGNGTGMELFSTKNTKNRTESERTVFV